ncbi:serine/threonine-protein kinase 32C-like [Sapajus apella]|uniref:Serine/threonine-protein kinase 32C-like n=1 Tax=Sapajus apella TaxID=9515 RepID=A0A6J3I6J9_SAPAP|nr:serine/threonine-protein kinase 32C-like [Sapajus apella]
MRSGAERRGSCAAAPPGSPPPGRARPSGPDAPPALQPPAAGQSRARDSGDARAQPRPLFPWSKWKKRMGSSMSAATARRPVFDDKEDGDCFVPLLPVIGGAQIAWSHGTVFAGECGAALSESGDARQWE